MSGLDALQRGFAQAPDVTRRELLAAMTEGTLLMEREIKDRLPRVTGMTAASVASDAFATPVGVIGTVGSSQPSATFLELGTRPHMPPVDALVPWVRAVLGVDRKRERSVAYLVARKIARRGTKAQRHFAEGAAATEGQVLRRLEDAAGNVAAFLAGQDGGTT
ncbi:HK97 gp10 family phage protein [Acidovorax cattleyae]|nr:HK97 gp10 family phage protein [Paracidovorax cattleyae]MBF9263391.1 HK97 gp10 family phage protein [Paracidovorax cattleyae]